MIPNLEMASLFSRTYDVWNLRIAACMNHANVPGAAAVIANNEGVLHTYAYGHTNIETKTPVSPIALFPIASISKNFTGTVLAMMVQDGHLHFDDPIKKHLPDVQIGPMDLWEKITCADLLSHHTGLNEELLEKHRYTLLSEGEASIIEALKTAMPSAPYKTKYQYFNPTYYLVPLLIQKFYGMDWKAFMKTRLFDPLGFKHTTAYDEEIIAREHTQLYMRGEDGATENVGLLPTDNYNMAGGIYSSALGLGKWIQFHLNNGAPLLEDRFFNQLYHPYTPFDAPSMLAVVQYARDRYNMSHYGLGIMVGSVVDSPVYMHEGAINGARSIFVVMPKQNIGAAILTNMGNHDSASMAMFYFMDEVLGLPFKEHKDALCEATP